ncbi:transporter [Dyella sp. A6]|uniref:transporter n=1 Tax=Dyella aluminiiresistens TaxID=3069105 RepID=UPI002E78437E|nr:transporter [Dyella sp. A6]
MDFSRYHAFRRATVAGLFIACLAAPAFANDNPGYDRPGLGFAPAVLQAGAVTWEQGLPDWSRAADGSSLYSADSLLRIGVGGPLELQLGSSYNRLDQQGMHRYGRGGSSLGLKFALPAHGAVSWGLLGSVGFTDGAAAFRNPRRDYLLGADIAWQRSTRNALGAYVENVRSGGRDSRLLALNDGYAITPTLSAYVEAAWQYQAGAGAGSMAGAGLAWLVTPRVQLDGSFRHRLQGQADTWEAGFGVSIYFGH